MDNKKIHPELLELMLEIIKNRQQMEEKEQRENNSSTVEDVDVVEKEFSIVEKESSIVEKDPSIVEDVDIVGKGSGG